MIANATAIQNTTPIHGADDAQLARRRRLSFSP
jgi:hypothetical protein